MKSSHFRWRNRGRLRLNCVGTLQDLLRQQIEWKQGIELTLYSDDLETEGQVQYSSAEIVWVAVIDWDAIREGYSEPNQICIDAAQAKEGA